MNSFFFDTYAFYEIIIGNENYKNFTKDIKIVTTQLNLMELYYHILSLYSKEDSLELFRRYEEFIVPIDNNTIIEAMDFRKNNYKRNLSYTDCIGYVMAKKLGVKFLTGDKEFKDMPNVEFVK